MPINLILVEDDPKFQDKFKKAINKVEDLQLLGIADDLPEGLEMITKFEPDILLVDLGLPSGNGVDLVRHTHANLPDCAIMVITVFDDELSMLACIEAGASGYLLKDSQDMRIVEQIRSLHQGGSPISPSIARHLLHRLYPPKKTEFDFTEDKPNLTAQEVSVLELICKGYSYGETAQLLELAPSTIETYIKRIYRKLQVHSKNEAVYEAIKAGLLKI